ncbi:MAG TPA: ABC transporter substrate-binding protein [Acetobacteraceae bacterium]|nr:ABC transporter substrate-binding protein [Acetobacteraceae bacterium]
MTRSRPVSRRTVLKLGAGAAALPLANIGLAGENHVLRFIPTLDLTVLDPHWSPTYVTRDHGYLVFDTLFGTDNAFQPQPQMVEGTVTDPDGKRWPLTLREGLKFHDGEPVLARDCVASIGRWGRRNSFGQTLMAATDQLSAADDRTIVFRLKKPFPLLPNALGTLTTPMPAILPERLAKTDAFTQIKEAVGSGPYRFKADERMAGARTVYEQFADYQPRAHGLPERTAGPKIAHFARVEWTVTPDASTAAAALLKGEQDWWDFAPADLLPLLRRSHDIDVALLQESGNVSLLRLNHLRPPFDNPRIRRALLGAVSQEDAAIAVAGADPSLWRTGIGYFPPVSPMASTAGMEALTGPRDLGRVRREIEAAGYAGERVVLLAAGDSPEGLRRSTVLADLMKHVGLAVDFQVSDWGTMMQRIFKKDSVDQGGWSCATWSLVATDMMDPAVNSYLRGNGTDARPGWPTSTRLEELRDMWLDAPDLATRQRIASEIQLQAFQDVPYIPLSLDYRFAAYRKDLVGVLAGFPVFWNVRRPIA